jgi:hypothetical protein
MATYIVVLFAIAQDESLNSLSVFLFIVVCLVV